MKRSRSDSLIAACLDELRVSLDAATPEWACSAARWPPRFTQAAGLDPASSLPTGWPVLGPRRSYFSHQPRASLDMRPGTATRRKAALITLALFSPPDQPLLSSFLISGKTKYMYSSLMPPKRSAHVLVGAEDRSRIDEAAARLRDAHSPSAHHLVGVVPGRSCRPMSGASASSIEREGLRLPRLQVPGGTAIGGLLAKACAGEVQVRAFGVYAEAISIGAQATADSKHMCCIDVLQAPQRWRQWRRMRGLVLSMRPLRRLPCNRAL